MAEIRTHDSEGGSDLGRLVREALGETIRPVMPGSGPRPTLSEDDPETDQGASLAALPQWAGLSVDVTDT